jgi:hypothetical protein
MRRGFFIALWTLCFLYGTAVACFLVLLLVPMHRGDTATKVHAFVTPFLVPVFTLTGLILGIRGKLPGTRKGQ